MQAKTNTDANSANGEYIPLKGRNYRRPPARNRFVSCKPERTKRKRHQQRRLPQISGDPTRTRTWDPMVKSHLLYRLSYRTTRRSRTRPKQKFYNLAPVQGKFHSDVCTDKMRIRIKRYLYEPVLSIELDGSFLLRIRFENDAPRPFRNCKFDTSPHQRVADPSPAELR